MKTSTLKIIAAMALAQTGLANAHDLTGSLGTDASAIDQYQVHCYDDGAGVTDHLYAAVKDLTPVAAPLVSIQVIRDNKATNSTDAVDGNATYSPTVKVKGSDGFFILTVDKTGAGAENYAVQYHCETLDNQHTGTDITQITNQ